MINVHKPYDFDTVHDRRNTASIKWSIRMNDAGQAVPIRESDVPLWVADMDFPTPPEILQALHDRVDHGFFGYTVASDDLKAVIVDRMKRLYDWEVQADWLLFNPGMVLFLNVVLQALTREGDGVLMNMPVYGPFHKLTPHRGRFAQYIPMRRIEDSAHTFHYEIDFEQFEQAARHPQSAIFFMCNPHNPTGRSYTKQELERLGEICLAHDILIAADEIHSDLLLGETRHTPIATLSPALARQTVTMFAGTKTFNMAGLACTVAIVPDEEKRQQIAAYSFASGYHTNTLAYEALLAGYRDADDWLQQVRQYITANRDYAIRYIQEQMPMLKTTVPEGTYLLWIDCQDLTLPDSYNTANAFFAEEAGVIFSGGQFFGAQGDFVRMNLACPRTLLQQGLERMREAIIP